MIPGREFESAITVRLGILGAGVLGGFAGYWIGTMNRPTGDVVLAWPVLAGAAAGLVTAWAALTWLARRHGGRGSSPGAFSRSPPSWLCSSDPSGSTAARSVLLPQRECPG